MRAVAHRGRGAEAAGGLRRGLGWRLARLGARQRAAAGAKGGGERDRGLGFKGYQLSAVAGEGTWLCSSVLVGDV